MSRQKTLEFTIGWKYSLENIVLNVSKIVKNFPVKFLGAREEYGDLYEVVDLNGKEFKFKMDSGHEYRGLEEIMNFVNEHLPDKNQRFVLLPGRDDSYTYRLERV